MNRNVIRDTETDHPKYDRTLKPRRSSDYRSPILPFSVGDDSPQGIDSFVQIKESFTIEESKNNRYEVVDVRVFLTNGMKKFPNRNFINCVRCMRPL
jgi:hypothetical protein